MMLEIPIISLQDFRTRVVAHLLKGFEDHSTQEVLEMLIDTGGIEKLDPEHLGRFVKSLSGHVFLPTCAVDTGDPQWVWVVCGTDAIVAQRPRHLR